ncbi:MAG: sorbosone dehydrogenase family protein [Steroidobacteraceae bacterium]
MQRMTSHRVPIACATLALVACAAACSTAPLSDSVGLGPDPVLPVPATALIPTVNVAPAVGWAQGTRPRAAAGMTVSVFANGLDHPRWLYVLPNGDVLVAETNAPPRRADEKGIKNRVMGYFMKKAGAATPSADRITLLRDTDGDGAADLRVAFVEGLHSPFGMALVGDYFFVANTDAVVRFPYRPGQQHIDGDGVKVIDLPAGPRNHHWTKSLIASVDGTKLYATVGSNSNVAEHGMAIEEGRAAIWEIDLRSGDSRIFATGLRNANGLAWEPVTGALWTTVNERDELGRDLVPDYMTAVRDGAFYGWPYSYYGQHVDTRVSPQRPDRVASAIAPDYALGAHTASLGLAQSTHNSLPVQFQQGMFVGQHGSWNRRPRSGYKVIFVPFVDGRPSGMPLDVLAGFVDDDGNARGRPVGVAIDTKGALLVADDVGNTVWRVTSAVPAR